MRLVERRIVDRRILSLIRAWLKAGVLEDGKVSTTDLGTPQGGVISPLLSNIYLHQVDQQWCDAAGIPTANAQLVRYADDMVLLARTEEDARKAWVLLQRQFGELLLVANQEKSRVTTAWQGFAFLGFEFRRPRWRPYMFPRTRAHLAISRRIRDAVRAIPTNEPLETVIRRVNPILRGWCNYFRVGNSNRVFHRVDSEVRKTIHVWLRHKHQCRRAVASRRWDFRFLHHRCRLFRTVGKVRHLAALNRKPPKEGRRRAGCGKTARPVR